MLDKRYSHPPNKAARRWNHLNAIAEVFHNSKFHYRLFVGGKPIGNVVRMTEKEARERNQPFIQDFIKRGCTGQCSVWEKVSV